jgi:hypothetical protein
VVERRLVDISLVKRGKGLRGGFDGAFGMLVGRITLGTILLCCILGGISSVDRILLGRILQGTMWEKSDLRGIALAEITLFRKAQRAMVWVKRSLVEKIIHVKCV